MYYIIFGLAATENIDEIALRWPPIEIYVILPPKPRSLEESKRGGFFVALDQIQRGR